MTTEEIKATREGLGLNITQMAALLGVDYDTYSQWERGRYKLPALGVTVFRWLAEGRINLKDLTKEPE
ncbi:helix-turn-helix domain-containing protein [Aeromonas rivipollensis]|uniref:helix-turn-helix domain-containing protein n=1 Tax=Aeromonas rivipollensis TaxID=948519 RepID=UPI0038D0CCC0